MIPPTGNHPPAPAGPRGARGLPTLWRDFIVLAAVLGLGLCLAPARAADSPRKDPDDDLKSPQPSYETLLPGLEYACVLRIVPALCYHVIRVDLRNRALRVGVAKSRPTAPEGREPVAEMARASDPARRIVAIVNGDYFSRGIPGPWGIHLQKGRLVYTPTGKSALLLDAAGRPSIEIPSTTLTLQIGTSTRTFTIEDINRPKNSKEKGFHLYSFTGEFPQVPLSKSTAVLLNGMLPRVGHSETGKITQVIRDARDMPVPPGQLLLCYSGKDRETVVGSLLKTGTVVKIKAEITPRGAIEGIGGGPGLVSKGKVSVDFEKEKFGAGRTAELKPNHPRTAVGHNRDKSYLYMVVVEGRSANSLGLNIESLAQLMRGLGCWDAMMFDGGGSSTLHTDKHDMNGEASGRHVSNGLAVYLNTPATAKAP